MIEFDTNYNNTPQEDELKVIYITHVGVDVDGLNVYHFLLSKDTEEVWQEGWEEVPACNMKGLQPDDDKFDYVKELKTEITFLLAQNCCCFSMSDCKDHCVALAIEDISDYEEYPEPCRIVIQFGESINDVESVLAKRNLRMRFI